MPLKTITSFSRMPRNCPFVVFTTGDSVGTSVAQALEIPAMPAIAEARVKNPRRLTVESAVVLFFIPTSSPPYPLKALVSRDCARSWRVDLLFARSVHEAHRRRDDLVLRAARLQARPDDLKRE